MHEDDPTAALIIAYANAAGRFDSAVSALIAAAEGLHTARAGFPGEDDSTPLQPELLAESRHKVRSASEPALAAIRAAFGMDLFG